MKRTSKQQAGFTIIELLVIMVIVAILAGIMAPSWLGFLNRQRINVAQSEAITAIRQAQARAKQQKRDWEVCFQDDGTRVRWSLRAPTQNGGTCATNPGPWNNIAGSDADKIAISSQFSSPPEGQFYRVRFKENGWVVPQGNPNPDPDQDLLRITFVPRVQQNQSTGSKRCVFVATILGATRTANDGECNP